MRILMRIAVALAAVAVLGGAPVPPPAEACPELTEVFLRFDAHDADFQPWVERFRTEIYTQWPLQAGALQLADKGRVEVEFTVGRSGRVERARVTQATGPKRLRQAAEGTIRSAQLLPLPPAYKPRSLKARTVFLVGEQP